MSYRLLFHPEFEHDVVRMARFIAENAGEQAALNAADRADQALVSLAERPHLAAPRNEIMPGLRIAIFPKSGIIPYLVNDSRQEVLILGVFYGGQEWTRHILGRR